MNLIAVEPFAGDTFETVHYRSCDFCYQTAVEDIWAGHINEAEWRQFFLIAGEGLTVCSNCLPGLEP